MYKLDSKVSHNLSTFPNITVNNLIYILPDFLCAYASIKIYI